jgi:hypothetical protein
MNAPIARAAVPERSVPGKVWVPTRMQAAGLACGAYELFLGGAAGPGKSEYLVVAPMRWLTYPTYRAILFRNSFPELERTLITKSRRLYPSLGGAFNESKHAWTFPSGARVEFSYLESDADVHRYQGAEYHFVGFDELPHFTDYQYRYMFSRLRATDGLPPRIRSTGNPDQSFSFLSSKKKTWVALSPFSSNCWQSKVSSRSICLSFSFSSGGKSTPLATNAR